jgi:hypothetical protein
VKIVPKKEYGSGYFGQWTRDKFDFPAYEYTCDQITDEKAQTPMNEMWRSGRDHYFLVGNDRIVGIASNFGYIKIRQDEGGPKYLNYYEPKLNQFAGGFGYLKDNVSELSTYYLNADQNLKRRYGIGYFQKEISDDHHHVNQIIFAPFGDDPLLISQVIITNNSLEDTEASWFEYWGCFNFQFSFQALLSAIRAKNSELIKEYRVDFEKKFGNKTIILKGNRGLFNMKFEEKSPLKDKQIDFNLRSSGIQLRNKPDFEDKTPPPIFLVSLDEPANGFCNDPNIFFGKGGLKKPDGLRTGLKFNHDFNDSQNCLVLERKIKLGPGQKKTLTFAYGYIPEDYNLNELISKYSTNIEEHLTNSLERWSEKRVHFKIDADPWIDREVFWHYYYLRGLTTFDSYFKEHILSQGHVYQYIIGFQGASRDPLQHALPFLFIEPKFVKEILRYTLKEIQKDGSIPYGITGNGMIMPSLWNPSDLQLWVLWLLSEYILSSRDIEFLQEELLTYPIHRTSSKKSTVKDLVYLTLDYFLNTIGKGKHGLVRVADCDWNDMVISGFVPEDKQDEVKKIGESCLNTAMTIHVFSRFIEMLSLAKLTDKIEVVSKFRDSLIKPMQEQWNGNWFKRAWLSEDLGWVGNDILWLEPQPWTIISEEVDDSMKERLIENINKLVRRPSPIGAIILSKPVQSNTESRGMATNAGIWPSINGTLVWALSSLDGNLAYEEWKKNLLANKAEQYPDIWYGIWSGPDTWNSIYSEYPGHTLFNKYSVNGQKGSKDEGLFSLGINWTDFPILNLHSHAWSLYNIFHLIGLKFTKEGIEFEPRFPEEQFKIKSPLISFEKNQSHYKGSYYPQIEGYYKITHKFESNVLVKIKEVIVNNQSTEFEVKEESIVFQGRGGGENPLTWKIILN